MGIERLKIKNFGCHKELKVIFGEITVITGDSNTGKSTIFKALRLLLHNKPLNAEKIFNYKHDKKNKFSIALDVNGYRIKRKGKTYKLINLKTKQEEVFKAFGTNVPVPIKEVLNLTDMNWQRQLDRHFLILESPGQRAKIINSVIGMEDSDRIIGDIKKRISTCKTDMKYMNEQKKEQDEIVKRLSPVKNLIEYAKELEVIEDEIQDLFKRISTCEYSLNEIESLKEYSTKLDKVNNFLKQIKILQDQKEEIVSLENKIQSIESNIYKIEEINDIDTGKINELQEFLHELISIEVESKSLDKKITTVNMLLKDFDSIQNSILDLESEIEKWDKLFQTEMKKFKICPLCSSKIN